MKKLLPLTVFFLFTSVLAEAQISKGAVLLGGNLSASSHQQTHSSNNNTTSQKGFAIAPSFGWVTKENTVWGINPNLSRSKSKNINYPEELEGTGYGASLFFRKYITLGKGFYLFGQGSAGYNQQKMEAQNTASNQSRMSKSRYVGVSAYPGIAFAVGKRFHLEAGLNELISFGYNKFDETTSQPGMESKTESSSFSFSTNLSNSNPLNVGFRWVLGK